MIELQIEKSMGKFLSSLSVRGITGTRDIDLGILSKTELVKFLYELKAIENIVEYHLDERDT